MERELEFRTGLRIDAALDRIRTKVTQAGMAGKWHIAKASQILTKGKIEGYVDLPEVDEPKYLEHLPELIVLAENQDQRCAECWKTGMRPEEERRYLHEREQLIRLFHRFQLKPKLYEQLTRQPDKPLLCDAMRLMRSGQENTQEAMALERSLRMRLTDFIRLEEFLADDFRDLDEAREELFTAHQAFALRIAQSQQVADESTVSSALAGLRKATAYYDHKRGYSFKEYAQHWVQSFIEKRRSK